MLTLWDILEQLCNGGFLVESFRPDTASRVGLYRIVRFKNSGLAIVLRCVHRITHCRRVLAIRSLWALAFMARLLLLTGKL